MIYTHNIPAGTYRYNAHTYIVSSNGRIIKRSNFSDVLISRDYTLVECTYITVHALELQGLIRSIEELKDCEIV